MRREITGPRTASGHSRQLTFTWSTPPEGKEGSLKSVTPDANYKHVSAYLGGGGFEIGAHGLHATAATNALNHQTESEGAGVARPRQDRDPHLQPPKDQAGR